jgi:nicotinate-nucleotide pyrophosphorylase (carboxylating)
MRTEHPGPQPLYPLLYEQIVRNALLEDLGRAGDLTTDAIVPAGFEATAQIVARQDGCVAGLQAAALAFRCLDGEARIDFRVQDGATVHSGTTLLAVQAGARAILSAERTALNILGRLCGIATATRKLSDMISGYPTRIVCTRKTTPGLRALEKYAVRAGGGSNHRFGLDDAVLIKDNHRIVAGGVAEAIQRARRGVGHLVKIQVEVDTLQELEEALREGVDAVLLDNMPVEQLKQAVTLVQKKAITEASGGITPDNIVAVAAAGVDLVSLGWLTHSAPALDVSLDVALQI